jgi:hypothetical protein
MNLQEFINTKIKKGVSEYDYFEIRKTKSIEYKKLSGLELQYLENGYVIYKEKKMDMDYKVHTYIFNDNELHLLITNYCNTNEYQYDFYQDNQISKTVWYMLESKTSLTKYDKYGRKTLRVNFPKSQSEKISGFKYIYTYEDRFNIVDKLQLERNIELEKMELTLWELEKYI